MWGFELAVMAAMIGINSVFAGYEIALASVSLARLRRLADDQRRGAKVALYMKQNMEASLAVVQLGITLVGAIAAAVGGAGAEENLAPAFDGSPGVPEASAEVLAIAVVVIPLTVVTIIVGELIPKVFALRHTERVCLTLSPFMRWFSLSVWPAVWLFETIVMGVMSVGRAPPGLGRWAQAGGGGTSRPPRHGHPGPHLASDWPPRRKDYCRGDGDALTPGQRYHASGRTLSRLDVNASLTDNLIAAHLDMHTRFPVVERKDDPQTIIGYVNFKDVVAAMRVNPQEPTLCHRSPHPLVRGGRADRGVS